MDKLWDEVRTNMLRIFATSDTIHGWHFQFPYDSFST